MSTFVYNILAVVLSCGVLYGIHLMSSPRTAVRGNALGAIAIAVAIAVTLFRAGIMTVPELWLAMAVGGGIGAWCSFKVKMIQMPQMVALLNSFGGAASALVALLTLADSGAADIFSKLTAALALFIGAVTFSGSVVAAGKLHQVFSQRPVILNAHSAISTALLALSGLLVVVVGFSSSSTPVVASLALLLSSLAFGVIFSIRVGGADMPITISLLNSLSGVAGSLAGMAISDPLLVAVGGVVGASGLLLTQIMCRAMNRQLMDILLGKTSSAGKPTAAPAPAQVPAQVSAQTPGLAPASPAAPQAASQDAGAKSPEDSAAALLAGAKRVLVVPGYGMALAQAQHTVKSLVDLLEANGADVSYAIHPVAGRMPGHMNVLLAEADVDYEKLLEMDDANPLFAQCDAVLVVGANDVINPAAKEAEGTPIYGMPVLDVARARHVVICNFDKRPGYAGVDNPLYSREDVVLLLGDASVTLETLHAAIRRGHAAGAGDAAQGAGSHPASGQPADTAASLLAAAKKVIIVPGYGMALAQAQHTVKGLADLLESRGADVAYAIHPVAGRMPGHMNVLLAEADVDYEKLLEMDAANPLFATCDAVLVVGANDVVNPAAKEAEGTPIYGMPVLDVADAPHVIICNFDLKPGYAGVENPLYAREDALLLLGDAAETVGDLTARVRDGGAFAAPAPTASATEKTPQATAAALLAAAKNVIIVPGYGMALAQAQHTVKGLADLLESRGADVAYAIHPVAGRMPGHMNVLLAEADVDYEKLLEMDAANPLFATSDAVLVVGANDVVNPAAKEAEGTPIYGMPVLDVADARHVIICNFDMKPGYAGVDNPLYSREDAILLLGDAAETVRNLTGAVRSADSVTVSPDNPAEKGAAPSSLDRAAAMLRDAREVVVVPGYGMALAQAQHKVKRLVDLLEGKGAAVSYAIHPVAGRMPGHMNVLLAEADVDYEKLLEMDAANPLFAGSGAVLVVGANDVINPAAREAEGTPIYGMPILDVAEAKQVIICNFDTKPGYAGVDNPLYAREDVVLLLGDAAESLDSLINAVRE